eukprot:TRINITY_DN8114_c0_g1_i1.p1 TRINITY_DN8114_c0_g1~~TRINITY_DN8114_c0_g1_i1.p1  ORF type:complete len:313 (+),score=52.67 TRINITY_DN8114_c0_g1_i1:52-990(+)
MRGARAWDARNTVMRVRRIAWPPGKRWTSAVAGSDQDVPAQYVQVGTQHEFCRGMILVSDWPRRQGLEINMMPFIMAADFEGTRLPESCRAYYEHIVARLQRVLAKEMGRVCYLSIDEHDVVAGSSQRREGLHTESPGVIPALQRALAAEGRGDSAPLKWWHHWGHARGHLEGGIYLGSNVEGSCAVYNAQVVAGPDEAGNAIGPHGDVEHLRSACGKRLVMPANAIYWITDRTPHESLPLASTNGRRSWWQWGAAPEVIPRQWFRLVTSDVSFWFRDHSTPNPNGVVPDPTVTSVVAGNKFVPEDLRIVPA